MKSIFKSIYVKVLLVILAIYSLMGFVLLPYLIQSNFSKIIKDKLNSNASLARVYINPFTLEIGLHNLLIQDDKNKILLYFKSFETNIEFTKLILGEIEISYIHINSLKTAISLYKNNEFNFSHMLKQRAVNAKEDKVIIKDKESLSFLFTLNQLLLQDTRLVFNDFTKSKNFEINTKPFNFEMQNFSTKKAYKNDREVIKKWLHVVLIKKIFGSSTDTILSQIRSAFTDDFVKIKIKETINEFPTDLISKKIKKDTSLSKEFVEELLCTQKDNKYTFSILSLLYPNLDYKNNDFHKDHLHPISKFKKKDINALNIDSDIKEFYYQNHNINNSIYNLQMLDANENMSKNDMDLKEWIDQEVQDRDKKQ